MSNIIILYIYFGYYQNENTLIIVHEKDPINKIL